MKKSVIYPGSFDPLTNGHVNIIERASKCFDEVIIGVAKNSSKNSILTSDERVKYIQLKYWNEIDEFIKRERKRNKIYHAIDANVSYLKLMFFMDKIKELKSKKIRSVKSIDNKAKADPYHERQTVDIDLEELKKKKKDNKSQYGGF